MTTLPYYTYMHTRKDNGRPFYIGKGSKHRAWDLRPSKRGAHWCSVAKKYGCEVHILCRWRSESDAHNHEIFLIKTMREMGIELVNKSSGGEGGSGYKWSDESRARLSASRKGKVCGEMNPMFGKSHSESARQKQSAAKAGRYAGSKHPRSTITEEIASVIRSAKGSKTAKQVAAEMGVSFHVVRNVWYGKSWRNV